MNETGYADATPPPPPPPPPPPDPGLVLPGNGALINPWWLVAAIVLLVVCIVAVRPSDQSALTKSPPPRERPGESTYTYWVYASKLVQPSNSLGQLVPKDAVASCRQMSTALDGLPTLGVDADVVQLVVDVSAVLRNLADLTEYSNHPQMLMDSFIRGFYGDPLGTTRDVNEAQTAVSQQIRYVQQQAKQLRAALTNRYAVEFPPF